MNYKAKLHKIKAFIFDFDGVISDGGVWDDVSGGGDLLRRTNVKDGYAIQYAVKKGYKVAVISGSSGEGIKHRMLALGVTDVFLSCAEKKEVFLSYLNAQGLEPEEVLYMGDDIPDYEVMLEAGVATCPADAVEEIRSVADYISIRQGGYGCVRDVIEQVLRLQNMWFHEEALSW